MFPLQRKKSVTYFLSYPHLGIKVHWKNSSLLRKITKGLSELLQRMTKNGLILKKVLAYFEKFDII